MKANTARRQAQRAYPHLTSCQKCGTTQAKRLERHHADHANPLAVEILCPSCHAKADQALNRRPAKQLRACMICGGRFLYRHSTNKTCSRKCLGVLGAQNADKRWSGHSRERRCMNCGVIFEPQRARAETCSRSCGNKLAWKNRKATRGKRNGRISHESRRALPIELPDLDHSETP